MLSSKFLPENEEKNIDGRWGGGGGGRGKRRGLGPRNDVLTTCKAVQNPYWPAVFLNGKPRFFSARQSAKTADWLEHNDVTWLVLHNCACAKKRSSK